MKKVALITTGGTIASKKTSSGLLTCTEINGYELASMCNLPTGIDIQIFNLFQIPSMHMSFVDMKKIQEKIEEVFEDESIDGVVVTHGTDSLEETAYFLDLTISDKRPIVVTGSQRSTDDMGSDVYTNLRNAVIASTAASLQDFGTVVVFNERIWSARHVCKVHSSNIAAFESIGYGYLGIIDNNMVKMYQKPIYREYYKIVKSVPQVDIIKCYSGADGKFVRACLESGVKGIVLEGAGRGQTSPLMMDEISKAKMNGVEIVITTSTEEGQVYPIYDDQGSASDLLSKGVILGGDYGSKKARIKLAILLAANEKSIEEKFRL